MANSDARRKTQWWAGGGCGIRATLERPIAADCCVTAFGQDEAALAKLRGAHGDTVRTGMLDGMMEIEAWRMSRARRGRRSLMSAFGERAGRFNCRPAGCLARSRSLGVALRTEPIDFAAAINPVVAIFAAGQPFDVAVLVAGQHGYNLPVALIDTVRSELYFCFCHPVFMHEPQAQRKPECGSAPSRDVLRQRGFAPQFSRALARNR